MLALFLANRGSAIAFVVTSDSVTVFGHSEFYPFA